MLVPTNNKDLEVIVYICSVQKKEIVYDLMDNIDFDKISKDNGVSSHVYDPFMLGSMPTN
jgi:hypothetical protein